MTDRNKRYALHESPGASSCGLQSLPAVIIIANLLIIIINKLILPTNLTTIHYHRALICLVHVPHMNRCNMRFALWKNGFNIVIGHHVVSCGESMPGPHSSITSFCATSAPYPQNMDYTFTYVFFFTHDWGHRRHVPSTPHSSHYPPSYFSPF